MRIEFFGPFDEMQLTDTNRVNLLGLHFGDRAWRGPESKYTAHFLAVLQVDPGETPPDLEVALAGPDGESAKRPVPAVSSANKTRWSAEARLQFNVPSPGDYELRMYFNGQHDASGWLWRLRFVRAKP